MLYQRFEHGVQPSLKICETCLRTLASEIIEWCIDGGGGAWAMMMNDSDGFVTESSHELSRHRSRCEVTVSFKTAN